MALTKPILNSVAAFDASNSQAFAFNVVGGSQVVGNTLTIKDNTTLAEVYSNSQTSFKLQHIVPAGTLTNGKYYQAYITTTDAGGNVSVQSNIVQFNCYTQPTFNFTNISDNSVVNNASYEFIATYNQVESEILNEYTFNLYDAAGILVSTSGKKYNTSTVFPLTISHLFSGLADNSAYSIEVVGYTAGRTAITTGRINFSVIYSSPRLYSQLYLTNNCKDGYITVETAIKPISGHSNPPEAVYIDNKEIDLRGDNSYVEWDGGYSFESPYTIRMWGRDFNWNNNILRLKNNNGSTVVLSMCSDGTDFWAELNVLMQGWSYPYCIMSNKLQNIASSSNLFIWLRADGDLYDLKIEEVE